MVTRPHTHTVLSFLPVRVTHKVPIVRRPMNREELMHNTAFLLILSSLSFLLLCIFIFNPRAQSHASTVLLIQLHIQIRNGQLGPCASK